jgi:cardiolipin synthase
MSTLGEMATSLTPAGLTWRELGSLPNLLTLSRIPLAAMIWIAPSNAGWLLGLMAAAAVSDLLDGWVARRARGAPAEEPARRAESIGAWLDPLCDKIFVLSALAAVWVVRAPPLWMAVVACTRELVVLALFIARYALPHLRGKSIPWRAMVFGKATTVSQFALFAAVLADLRAAWPALAMLSGLLGLAAGVQYALRAWRTLHPERSLSS